MNINEIFGFVGAVLCSLGGGTVIISAASKWFGDFMAQKLLANAEHKHEKEIEQYKAKLQDMSTQFSIMVEHSMQVATKQYDMEVAIYQNIWNALHDLYMCQNYIYHFENPTQANPVTYLETLKTYNEDFKGKLENFQKQIDSAAPFYQIEAYELLCEINNKYIELLHIIDTSVSLDGMTIENKTKVHSEILPIIKDLKVKLMKEIREYLLTRKKIPDIG